jgi:outer membrane lipoprotein carrier protein
MMPEDKSLRSTIRSDVWKVALLFIVVCFLLFSVSLRQNSGQASAVENPPMPTKDEAVRSVENHYSELIDLTAQVVQKNFLKAIGKTQTFEAQLYLKKPGRLKLDYTNGQNIVIDGKEAWFYSKKSEQVIKRTFSDFEHANIPVAFLLGAATIRNDFEVVQPDPKAPRLLELVPKKPGAVMKKLRIETDDAGRITELIIFDKSGNTSEIRFSDIQENVKLEDKQFQFSVPRGTEIIEQ